MFSTSRFQALAPSGWVMALCAAASSLVVAACGPREREPAEPDGAPPGPEAALLDITVTPADQLLVIEGADPATSAYTAVGHFDDGTSADITDQVVFSLESPWLGSFEQNAFTSTTAMGGRTRVVAVAGGVEGSTGLVLRLRQRHVDPASSDLPSDPAGAFAGQDDPGRAPGLVYPNDGVLLPPNLRLLEFHFTPGEDNTLFEVSFQNDLTDVVVYARCATPVGAGCVYLPDELVWGWLAETNRGGAELEVRLRGTDDGGGGVGTSATSRLAFSFENVLGGIYYWKAAGGVDDESAIMRFDFGDTEKTAAEKFVGPERAGGKCVGCHALSRDGTRMVAAAGGWDVEEILLLDVATGDALGAPAKSAFSSWNPDGSAYVGVFAYGGTTDYDLLLFDGSSGARIGTIGVGATAAEATSHPDWSPDGQRIAFVRAGAPFEGGVNNQRFYRGSIEMVEHLGGGLWSAPVTLVTGASDRNHYYPSFSPDGGLVIYNRSLCPSGELHRDCNADSDPTAAMLVVRPEPGATPVALDRANAPGPSDAVATLTSSWPRWAPFEYQRTEEPGTRLQWITFSSTREFGLRSPPPASNDEALSGTLLWMAAVDPDRALLGEDPSYPAFYLPFQDLDTSNHIAQWTEQVVLVE